MSLISTPYIFQPGTTIASAQVNANFAAIVGVVNGNLDGTNFSTVFTQFNKSAHGSATIAGGMIFNWGSPSAVAFDNSAVTSVTFDTAYTTSCFLVVPSVVLNTQTHPNLVVAYAYSIGTTGFSLTAEGGTANQAGTVNWIAIGY